MRFKTAICDDQQLWVDMLVKKLEHYNIETGIEFDISTFLDPEELLSAYTEPGCFDFLFLDMEMPVNGKDIKGIDVAKKIRSLPDYDVKIIFVSSYPAYMQMGYDVQASHYLYKGSDMDKFDAVLNNIIALIKRDTASVIVKVDRDKHIILKTKDICYIRSFPRKRDYIEYITSDGTVKENRPLAAAADELKARGFDLVNKNVLVNFAHIKTFSPETVLLDNGQTFRRSRRYKQSFFKHIMNYSFEYM